MADPNTERDPLEILAAEYMERMRQGQQPSMEEYASQHPELAEEIRDLFPTIAIAERVKVKQARSSDGRATLGPAQLERLGDFRLIREIGRGGMGVVFEAEQESLGRRVALKVLPRQVLLDEKHLRRFEREARITANLHHTNIVEVFGVGEQDGYHYYVMQLVHGVGLDAVVPRLAEWGKKGPTPADTTNKTAASDNLAETAAHQLLGGGPGRIDPHYWQKVARIGVQAADALNYAHSQQMLHRDIKPANLLLDPQGTVWLTDFGLAKAAQSEDLSVSNDVVGTVRYMAPEQFSGNVDRRSDIYSLGLTLYELLALRPAYEEADQSRLIQRITQGPPPPAPASLHGEVPRDLETIILKATSRDANERYQSAGEMVEDLRCFLEDRPISARRVGPVERLGRWCRRNKTVASLTGATMFLLVAVAVVASVGYARTKRALKGEALERGRAEATADLAGEALERIFEQFSPARIRTVPVSPAGAPPTSEPILSKEAAAMLEQMLPFYDRLAQQTGNSKKLRRETANANRHVGAIRQRLGGSERAVEHYQRAIALYEGLRADSPRNAELKIEVAQTKNELGQLYTSLRRPDEARETHLAAMAMLQTDGGSPLSLPAGRFELARTCYLLGTQLRPLPGGNPGRRPGPGQFSDEQRDYLSKAVALLKELAASTAANSEYQHLLALCYLEGAAVEGSQPPGMSRGDELAIGILEHLVQTSPEVTDYAYDLSEAYARMHIPEPPIPPEAKDATEERLNKSLALLKQLAERHPNIPEFQAAKARTHDKLGGFYRQLDQWAEAQQQFHEAIALQGPLVKQSPESWAYTLWMARFRIALADVLVHQNKADEARRELEDTISTLLRQLRQRPSVPPPHDLLALGYSRLAIALRQTGEKEQADEAARKAEQEEHEARQ